MKKKVSVTVLFAFILSIIGLGGTLTALADEKTPENEFRVGLEAGYAPFNWSQQTDANGAVKISGQQAYAGGYDVQIAKKVAEGLGKELVIQQIKWDGLAPALQSGKIDAIIAGMSPTAERKKEIDFTDPYYESQLVIVTQADSKYADAKSIEDFAGAALTAQLNTFHYNVIDQIPDVKKEQAMDNFSAMRTALSSGVIDGYVSERPEGITAESVDKKMKMIEFEDGQGFETNPEDVQIAVGMRKGDPDVAKVNGILAGISSATRIETMDQAIKDQPAATDKGEEDAGLLGDFKKILSQYGMLFLRGSLLTLGVALFGTIAGTTIGLLIGVFRTVPKSENKLTFIFQKIVNWLLSLYIEIFRGTPMMVQAMVIFYGLALAFGLNLNKTVAALLIVSVNTGAYMSEIVRGGIFAVDEGQFEAAQAIGMTHNQTMSKVVLPQVLRNILPATGNEFVINIKDTSVLSVIGVADLFFQGNSASGANFQFFQVFTIIGIIYLVMTFTITRILRLVEKRIDGPASYVQLDEEEVLPQEK
ncbi:MULTISPECIES: ABC transporter permease subunit [Enterococcus]|uniref:ABC transporter permease subunit n=1 Tax=Enterococcus TaxID=1350 RepID=UPI0010F6DA03|nr:MULTISPECIES: ABC transporter permease subunit [Enterococcus]KAF1300934.1 amino acid ABC transporter permease [Enterococcus sp. JM9B]